MISGASIDRCVRILLTTFYHMHHYTVQRYWGDGQVFIHNTNTLPARIFFAIMGGQETKVVWCGLIHIYTLSHTVLSGRLKVASAIVI